LSPIIFTEEQLTHRVSTSTAAQLDLHHPEVCTSGLSQSSFSQCQYNSKLHLIRPEPFSSTPGLGGTLAHSVQNLSMNYFGQGAME
jgi:hypothetical protein